MRGRNKKVTVCCPTKFHSDYMANQLADHSILDRVYTAHPKSRYMNRTDLPVNKIRFISPIFTLPYFTNKITILNRFTVYLNENLPIFFDFWVSKIIRKTDIVIVWAWAGLNTIKSVKRRGTIAILEECGSCNKFQNEILTEEYKLLNLPFMNPTSQNIIDRELKEAEMADYILCPSNHVARSFIINGFAPEKCKIIPYGVNIKHFKPKLTEKEKFTIIFVGSIGVRKGLIYLFEAIKSLKAEYPIEAVIIGKVDVEFLSIFEAYKHLFKHVESVPHKEMVNYYNSSSVFVLPSLDEGMAYVQLEAMACGLPIVCTPNSGAEAIVNNGEEGFIVPIRNAEQIAEKIELLYLNKELLLSMSAKSYKTAQNFSWDAYGKKLAAFISEI